MQGLYNFVEYIQKYWFDVALVLAICAGLIMWEIDFLKKNKDEKVEAVKSQLKQIMLQLVTSAEESYADIKKSGAIKRSWVLDTVYNKFPILSKIKSQEEVIEYIDGLIDEALVTMRSILSTSDKE